MRVRRRFPTLQYVVDAGFMEEEELEVLENVNCNPGQKYWVPINWANSLALEAHQKKLIDQPTAFNNLVLVGDFPFYENNHWLSLITLGINNILQAIKEFRVSMETLIKFDSIPIPIAYPQVMLFLREMQTRSIDRVWIQRVWIRSKCNSNNLILKCFR